MKLIMCSFVICNEKPHIFHRHTQVEFQDKGENNFTVFIYEQPKNSKSVDPRELIIENVPFQHVNYEHAKIFAAMYNEKNPL